MRITGLQGAIDTQKGKLQHKKDNALKSLGFVKQQQEQLRGILKNIDKKLIKRLYKLLEDKTPEKIVKMMEALVGMLRNQRDTNCVDVEVQIFLCIFLIDLPEKP